MSNHYVVWLRLTLISLWLVMLSLVLLTIVVRPGHAADGPPARPLTCDQAKLSGLEHYFQQLSALHSRQPAWIGTAELQVAALNYIASAEACYQAMLPLAQEEAATLIDEGGLWAPGSAPAGDVTGQAVIAGTKWPGSTFGVSNPPGTPGGLVTYSYIAAGVSHAVEGLDGIFDPQPNVDVRTGLGIDGCVKQEIRTAFNAWAAVADIRFVQVADSGLASDAVGAGGDIRIGAHTFFNSTRLAHTFFPPPNGQSLAGDIHFNWAINWSCVNTDTDKFDIGLVALHEIGHAIGLDHEPPPSNGGAIAVMNATFNSLLTLLQPDDRAGIISIYGAPTVLGSVEDGSCGPFVEYKGQTFITSWLTDTLGTSPTRWRPDGAEWVVENSNTRSDTALLSPLLSTTETEYVLSFRHRYQTQQSLEGFYDGGTVEISSTSTMAWTEVGQADFTRNGYNGQITDIFGPLQGNPLAGSLAFAGDSQGFIESVADLTNFTNPGDTFQIRFHFGADNLALGNPDTGGEWRISEVALCQAMTWYFPVIFKQ